MTIAGSFALALRIVSLGALTNFNRKYFIAKSCEFILWSIGINVVNRVKQPLTEKPYFITFNHNSFLDGFVLMSMGFPNTRVVMSYRMIYYIPATLISLSIGVLYIPQKEYPKSRLNFFKRLEKRLKKENTGFIGSSEGVHEYTNEINEFNRGVYHTAMLCALPVFALYIYTPEASNPMAKFKPFKRGTIFIDLIDIIETKNWTLENLDFHIEEVRSKYIIKDQQIKLEYGK